MPENHSTTGSGEEQIIITTPQTRIKVITVPQVFYQLNKEQLEILTGLSWLTNFFFVLAGITGGGLISCWVGRQQVGLTLELAAKINTAFSICVILTVLFFLLAFCFAGQHYMKQYKLLKKAEIAASEVK